MARSLPDLDALALACLGLLLSALPNCGGRAASDELNPAPDNPSAPEDPPLPSDVPGGSATPPSAEPTPETCEDNPLLANCAPTTCPENPLACPVTPPLSVPMPAPALRSEDLSLPLVVRMEALLEESCGTCHGASARTNCEEDCGGGLTDIDDMSALLEDGLVLPCDWAGSPLSRRMRDSSMPPHGPVPPMPLRAQWQLESFVEGMCTDLLYPGNSRLLAAQRVLLDNCSGCHGEEGPDGGAPPGGLGRVDDAAALLDNGFIIPCRSQVSPLILAIQNGSMPPPESGLPPVPAEQLASLVDFIDGPCAR